MQVTTTYRYDTIKWAGIRLAKCSVCGKRKRRQKTFSQTASPFNKHKDGPRQGQVKTPLEIQNEVRAAAHAWEEEPHVCAQCDAQGGRV